MDLAEVILKWELQRIKDDQEQTTTQEVEFSVWCSCSTLKSLSTASKQLKMLLSFDCAPVTFILLLCVKIQQKNRKAFVT